MPIDCTGGFAFSDSAGLYSESVAYSIAAWVNRAATTSTQTFYGEASRSTTVPILSLQTGATSGRASVFLRNNANTIGILNIGTALTVFDGTWHHFAYVQDGAGNWQVYVDGAADSNCHGTFTPGAITVPTIGVGCLRQNPTTQTFGSGKVAHVATWQRQLAAQEVKSLANGMIPSRLGPQRYWPLWIAETTFADLGSTHAPLGIGNAPTTAIGGPPVALRML